MLAELRSRGMKTALKTPFAKKKKRTRPHAKRMASTGGRFGLTDELWALMEPCLSEHKHTHRFGGGRPRVPDRQCAEAIFFVRRTGCQWNALAATGLCPSSPAPDRFQEWVVDGSTAFSAVLAGGTSRVRGV